MCEEESHENVEYDENDDENEVEFEEEIDENVENNDKIEEEWSKWIWEKWLKRVMLRKKTVRKKKSDESEEVVEHYLPKDTVILVMNVIRDIQLRIYYRKIHKWNSHQQNTETKNWNWNTETFDCDQCDKSSTE